MEIEPKPPSVKGGREYMTGEVWMDVLTGIEGPACARVLAVHFAPGARTRWHSHARGQTLYVTQGAGRVQARSEEVLTVRAGDVVYSPPGEWHWHGAAADHFMTHIAITDQVEGDDGGERWGAEVTDAEYRGERREAR